MTHNTNQVNGVLNIDKPSGVTSHDIVAQVRRLFPRGTKVGHTGTLDPMATGVLLVAVGKTTRLIQYTHDLPKTYQGTITLGSTSDTDDAEGVLTSVDSAQPLLEAIQKACQKFIGVIVQQPPAYSAIKYQGKKLYEYARRGEAEEVLAKVGESRKAITIYDITILSYTYPEVVIKVECSSGTYIRSLARDIGEALTTGGYLSALRRTAIGSFFVEQSVELKKLSTSPSETEKALQESQTLVQHLPAITLDDDNVVQYRQGKQILVSHISPTILQKISPLKPYLVMLDNKNELVGIATYDPTTSLLSPKTVLA